ncbi:hypothetical protein FRC11_007532 [Ceratobasidium sp. 423]|nr:hypothetical protein FRC11_007532 [Ceratobasidium sp. 423]
MPNEGLQGYASSKKLMMDIMSYMYEMETLPGFEHIHQGKLSLGESDEESKPMGKPQVVKSKAPVWQLKQAASAKGTDEEGASNEDEGDDGKTTPVHLTDDESGGESGPSKALPRKKLVPTKTQTTSTTMLPPKKHQTTMTEKKHHKPKVSQPELKPKPKPKPKSKSKAAKVSAPDKSDSELEAHPVLGKCPRAGTKAQETYNKQLLKLETEGHEQDNNKSKALKETQGWQHMGQSSASLRQPVSDHAISATTLELGNGKECETISPLLNPLPTSVPNLMALQAQIFSKVVAGALSIAQAQEMLITLNKPPLPLEIFPDRSVPKGSEPARGSEPAGGSKPMSAHQTASVSGSSKDAKVPNQPHPRVHHPPQETSAPVDQLSPPTPVAMIVSAVHPHSLPTTGEKSTK